MRRFFGLWIGLGLIATLVTYAVGLAVFRFVDLTFTQFAILLVAPAAQAAVLLWPVDIVARIRAAVTAALRQALAPPVLLLDGVLLVAGVVWWSSSALGYGASVSAQTTWIGAKALAAAGLCLVTLRDVPWSRRLPVVCVLLLVAVQSFGAGLEWAFQVIDGRAQSVPEVVMRLLFFGAVYAGSVAAVLHVGRGARAHAGVWVTVAVALTIPALMLVVLSYFNHPGVLAPWRGLALVCASASVTALLLGVVTMTAGEDVRS